MCVCVCACLPARVHVIDSTRHHHITRDLRKLIRHRAALTPWPRAAAPLPGPQTPKALICRRTETTRQGQGPASCSHEYPTDGTDAVPIKACWNQNGQTLSVRIKCDRLMHVVVEDERCRLNLFRESPYAVLRGPPGYG